PTATSMVQASAEPASASTPAAINARLMILPPCVLGPEATPFAAWSNDLTAPRRSQAPLPRSLRFSPLCPPATYGRLLSVPRDAASRRRAPGSRRLHDTVLRASSPKRRPWRSRRPAAP